MGKARLVKVRSRVCSWIFHGEGKGREEEELVDGFETSKATAVI